MFWGIVWGMWSLRRDKEALRQPGKATARSALDGRFKEQLGGDPGRSTSSLGNIVTQSTRHYDLNDGSQHAQPSENMSMSHNGCLLNDISLLARW